MNNVDIPLLADESAFRDHVAVVTGGTDGIGRHLAQSLISLGCEVFFCGRREKLGTDLEHEWGDRAHFVRCDLADSKEIETFIEKAGEFKGSIDYLINNAAMDPVVKFEESSLDQLNQLLAVNLRSYFLTAQASLPYLKKGKGKAIVNIGTTNWMLGHADYAMYATSKAGIVGLTRSLSRDLGPQGIRTNMLSLGWIMTQRQLRDKVDEAAKQRLLEDTAMPYLLYEKHVSPAILFLLSSSSAGICGQNIVLDGGKYLQ